MSGRLPLDLPRRSGYAGAMEGSNGRSGLDTLLDRQTLRRMAGARSFARGEEYAAQARVTRLERREGSLLGVVQGNERYSVRLWPDGAGLAHSCTCPLGRDGVFCKHCVAVGLAWLDAGREPAPAAVHAAPTCTEADLRAWLASRDPEDLVAMLLQQAMEDDHLLRRLQLAMTQDAVHGPDLATWRQLIDSAVRTTHFVEYREATAYAQGIEQVVDGLEELLATGHAAKVVTLAEHALAGVEQAIESVDGSDGCMGSILERLQDLHLAACAEAHPEPEALARRLFAWQMRTEWDVFDGAVERYADILGESGLALYRELAETEWAKLPALGPHDDDPERYGRRLTISSIMEQLAARTGDLEALVAVKRRDLSSPYRYLEIAGVYAEAGQGDRAIEWAEQGLRAFPGRPDPRLRELLAELYHRHSRHADAMALVWAGFEESPGLERFNELERHASRCGQWPEWRSRALETLRQAITRARQDASRPVPRWMPLVDHTELVRIFLAENDVEAAWQEAQQGGCRPHLWLDLADRRAEKHPADSLAAWQAQLDPTIAGKNNDAYRAAVALLRKIRAALVRLDREREFDPYLASVRAAHKPKRNLVKMLDHATWE